MGVIKHGCYYNQLKFISPDYHYKPMKRLAKRVWKKINPDKRERIKKHKKFDFMSTFHDAYRKACETYDESKPMRFCDWFVRIYYRELMGFNYYSPSIVVYLPFTKMVNIAQPLSGEQELPFKLTDLLTWQLKPVHMRRIRLAILYYSDIDQVEIGENFGITKQRVNQLIENAKPVIRKELRKRFPELINH